ncbi:MAG: hypothetical protein WBC44_03040, partial [Planctomycetaceae bacterium]
MAADVATQTLAEKPAGRSRTIRLVLNLNGAIDGRLRAAVSRLRALNHRVDVRVAWDPADAVFFAREAAEQGYD